MADVIGLLRTKSKLKRRLQEYQDGNRHLWEVYEPFNTGVLKGRPVEFIQRVIEEYARESKTESPRTAYAIFLFCCSSVGYSNSVPFQSETTDL